MKLVPTSHRSTCHAEQVNCQIPLEVRKEEFYFLKQRLYFLFHTVVSDSVTGLTLIITCSIMCVACSCVYRGPSVCKTLNPGSRACSRVPCFPHTCITTHLSINRLDCQGHFCCPLLCSSPFQLLSPALSGRTAKTELFFVFCFFLLLLHLSSLSLRSLLLLTRGKTVSH